MKDTLLMLCDEVSNWWKEALYEYGFGPAPWSHLDCIKTIHCDGELHVNLYSCNCGYGNYLIDLRAEGLVRPTIMLCRSQDLNDLIELLLDTRLAIASYEYRDD